MIDVQKQIAYWRKGAIEDFPVGKHLVIEGNIRHGLFFIHLSLEKIIKAHVCNHTKDLAPRTHNLLRLIQLTKIVCSEKDLDLIADMNHYNIEGRYPDSLEELPSGEDVQFILHESERVFEWLLDLL